MLKRFVVLLGLLPAELVSADCFDSAAERHQVSAHLLRAIACVESNFDAHAMNRNRNGSIDYGLMQINSLWLTELGHFGIERDHLWDPCTNIHVGAWVLRRNMQMVGNNWRAIGAYHAGLKDTPETETLRYEYAKKVYDVLDRGC